MRRSLALVLLCTCCRAFVVPRVVVPNNQRGIPIKASRYGPPADRNDGSGSASCQEQLIAFEKLIQKIDAANPDDVPSIMSSHITFILSLEPQVIEVFVERNPSKSKGTIDMILSFASDFVEEAKSLDDKNKRLLGKIVKTIAAGESKEEDLESLLEEEQFSAGFLRHLDGECERILNAPSVSPESLKLVQILRTVQTRVLEELGKKELGDAALVLGQLVAYDSLQERMAVLQTGLAMRGQEFGTELAALTQKALQDFERIDADPELVARVQGIDDSIAKFLAKEKT